MPCKYVPADITSLVVTFLRIFSISVIRVGSKPTEKTTEQCTLPGEELCDNREYTPQDHSDARYWIERKEPGNM